MPPVWVLVRGAEVASATWSLLDRWSLLNYGLPPGAWLGQRWWLMAAPVPLPLPAGLWEGAGRAERALVLARSVPSSYAPVGVPAGPWQVYLGREGSWQRLEVDPAGAVAEAVVEFSRDGPGRVGGWVAGGGRVGVASGCRWMTRGRRG